MNYLLTFCSAYFLFSPGIPRLTKLITRSTLSIFLAQMFC